MLKPFADDAASISIGELTVENGTDRIALYGSLDLTVRLGTHVQRPRRWVSSMTEAA